MIIYPMVGELMAIGIQMYQAKDALAATCASSALVDQASAANIKTDGWFDNPLLGSVKAAMETAPIDLQRACIMGCFATPTGIVQKTEILQAGSLRDVAFYERQVVERCFQYNMNLVVLVIYIPSEQRTCPSYLVARFSRFSQALHRIEMSMPYVVWKSGSNMQILRTHLPGATDEQWK